MRALVFLTVMALFNGAAAAQMDDMPPPPPDLPPDTAPVEDIPDPIEALPDPVTSDVLDSVLIDALIDGALANDDVTVTINGRSRPLHRLSETDCPVIEEELRRVRGRLSAAQDRCAEIEAEIRRIVEERLPAARADAEAEEERRALLEAEADRARQAYRAAQAEQRAAEAELAAAQSDVEAARRAVLSALNANLRKESGHGLTDHTLDPPEGASIRDGNFETTGEGSPDYQAVEIADGMTIYFPNHELWNPYTARNAGPTLARHLGPEGRAALDGLDEARARLQAAEARMAAAEAAEQEAGRAWFDADQATHGLPPADSAVTALERELERLRAELEACRDEEVELSEREAELTVILERCKRIREAREAIDEAREAIDGERARGGPDGPLREAEDELEGWDDDAVGRDPEGAREAAGGAGGHVQEAGDARREAEREREARRRARQARDRLITPRAPQITRGPRGDHGRPPMQEPPCPPLETSGGPADQANVDALKQLIHDAMDTAWARNVDGSDSAEIARALIEARPADRRAAILQIMNEADNDHRREELARFFRHMFLNDLETGDEALDACLRLRISQMLLADDLVAAFLRSMGFVDDGDEGDAIIAAAAAALAEDDRDRMREAIRDITEPTQAEQECLEGFAAWVRDNEEHLKDENLEAIKDVVGTTNDIVTTAGGALSGFLLDGSAGASTLANGIVTAGASLFYAWAQGLMTDAVEGYANDRVLEQLRVRAELNGRNPCCTQIDGQGVDGGDSTTSYFIMCTPDGRQLFFRISARAGLELLGAVE